MLEVHNGWSAGVLYRSRDTAILHPMSPAVSQIGMSSLGTAGDNTTKVPNAYDRRASQPTPRNSQDEDTGEVILLVSRARPRH